MIDRILELRNKIYRGKFRFALAPEHWRALYVLEDWEESNLATVVKNERLKGYAAYYLTDFDNSRAYEVREICAEDEETLAQLIDHVIEKSVEDDVDFVFVRRGEEPYENVFAEKGFFSFPESVVMVILFKPRELLLALSRRIEKGDILHLLINGFDPVPIRVGEEGIMVVEEDEPDLVVSTDARTFLRLFFGRTSLLKEVLGRRIRIGGVLNWTTANHFFNLIKQDKWHIPMGDWV